MNHAKLLDCTLRDGAYLVDKKFGDNTIRGIIDGLLRANIDYIEIGFFQDEGFGDGKTVYKNSADAARFVPADKKNSIFTVLADFSRYSVDNLDECTGKSVDAIRECFFKKERFEAMNACRVIKEKGYKLFVQPVDILGYTDAELIEFINMVNEVEPYCLSIVDTFGSMYQEDLHRVFELIHHNLSPECKIGFHSHNNMQLSNALSQEFIRMTVGKREVIVDSTMSGMGRGAGNTPTELVAQYMSSQLGYNYDMDVLLDIIDSYMENIKSRCEWGYSTPYFVAGCYSAHVNNITYLTKKNSIRSKDIRYILNKIGSDKRKRYDYDLLERTYIDLLNSEIDDSGTLDNIRDFIGGRPVLIVAPGSSIADEKERIKQYSETYTPVIISTNFIYSDIKPDYIYISNVKRYQYWKNSKEFTETKKIITSNINDDTADSNTSIVSFMRFLKCGWEHMDNSAVMLLRMLDYIGVSEIAIAGFDGYDYESGEKKNFASRDLDVQIDVNELVKLNREISEMLIDFNNTRQHKDMKIRFITNSRFERCFEYRYAEMKKNIKFLVMDVDGTLTDGKIYMGNDGELFKSFDIKDGCGIKDILPRYGIIPVIITARRSCILENRCKELEIEELHQGIRCKIDVLNDIIEKHSEHDGNITYDLSNVAYIGDDILDLQCMNPVCAAGGLVGCPADAVREITEISDFVSCKTGGNGAVREFIEWIVE